MNEQQLQQILTIQQAIAAAATAAVINSLLNPQQAAGLAPANALTDPSNDLQQQLQQLQQLQQHQQQQQQENRLSPPAVSPTNSSTAAECNTRIQDLLMQLQQQAASAGQLPMALNLNLGGGGTGASNNLVSPIRSPESRLTAQELNNAATSSNTQQPTHNQVSPMKKLKRHHHQQQPQHQQQPFHNRSSEATSKPQHSSPKNHSNANPNSNRNNNPSTNTSSSSSSAFMANNVGLPRKLVRGQDVWLGRGAEQTRQILKCMWCGQSFRTLAEMTQHMKVTQHYANIVSQEQITSWRQPENSEASNKHGKQSNQVRSLNDNLGDSSDKFNNSDREDTFSNDDDLDQHKHRPLNQQNRLDHNKSDLTIDNNSTTESNHGDSPQASKGSPSSKPLTRSRKRENDTLPIKRDCIGRENSPATSSSSQQRQNSSVSNLILGDINEDSESNKERKTNGNSQELSQEEEEEAIEDAPVTPNEDGSGNQPESDNDDDNDKKFRRERHHKTNGDSKVAEKLKAIKNGEQGDIVDAITAAVDENDDDVADGDGDGDVDRGGDDGGVSDNDDDQASETNESVATTPTSGAKSCIRQKGETGDPLSALETMVEKSFDPRLRPGVANGGILQRLGIDEEVCPPWQHINYANWYAAAAYGHPMAAALLAAGINLQNGIKLSKNATPKKNED